MRLALEDFAKACAELDAGVSRSRVLGRLGLDESAWTELEGDAIGSLRRAFEAGDRSVALRFAAGYEAARPADLTEPVAALAQRSAADDHRAPAIAAAEAGPRESERSGMPDDAPAAASARSSLDETAAVGIMPIVDAPLPFRPAPAATAPLPHGESIRKAAPDSGRSVAAGAPQAKRAPAAAAPPTPGDSLDETAEVDLALVMKASLPFGAPRPAEVPSADSESGDEAAAAHRTPGAGADAQQAEPARPASAQPRSGDSLDETAEVDLALLMKASLPFKAAGGEGAPAASTAAIDETAVLGVPVVVEQPLPFERPDGPVSAPARAGTEPLPHPEAGQTLLSTPAVVAPATPFDDREPPRSLESEPAGPGPVFDAAPLTLQQLAAVHVELQLAPASEPEVLRTYGLTADRKRRLDAELQRRCRQDPRIAKAWEHAWRTYLEWRKRRSPR